MKLNIQNLLQKKSSFATFKKQDLFLNQSREWIRGLLLATFLFCISAVYIGFDFYTQLQVSSIHVETSVKIIEYRENDVREYSDKYNKKEDQFNTLLKKREVPIPQVVIPVTEKETNTSEPSDVEQISPLADIQLGQ